LTLHDGKFLINDELCFSFKRKRRRYECIL